jgi:hypothetical protein
LKKLIRNANVRETHDCTFYNVSLGTLAGLLGTVTGMIKALSAAGTQIKLLLQMVFLRH